MMKAKVKDCRDCYHYHNKHLSQLASPLLQSFLLLSTCLSLAQLGVRSLRYLFISIIMIIILKTVIHDDCHHNDNNYQGG